LTGVYVDTSVLGRVLLGEPDAPAVLRELGRYQERLASRLLRVELRRLALREGRPEAAGELLAGVAFVPLEQSLLDEAEVVLPATVATLDAIHLATALRLARDGVLDTVMTYDRRLAAGAAHHGLQVLAPVS
jgi:predicted nucleic acid-binding protein